jgi:hypothetical protein
MQNRQKDDRGLTSKDAFLVRACRRGERRVAVVRGKVLGVGTRKYRKKLIYGCRTAPGVLSGIRKNGTLMRIES